MAASQVLSNLSYNDGVLVVSLLYLCMDINSSWEEFRECRWPVHRWLLVSYAFIIMFRFTHIVGEYFAAADSGDFLLNLRHKGTLARTAVSMMWFLMLPFFTLWTGLGSFWLVDSKRHSAQCLPMSMLLCFIIIWQLLSYAWIVVHLVIGSLAWINENRLRKVEFSLRAIEDSDMLARWGQVSSLPSQTALVDMLSGGLTPEEISSLPHGIATEADVGDGCECSICLGDINAGDSVRELGVCGHAFHRPCLDLWLLRRADCPLCKRSVKGVCSDGGHDRDSTQTRGWLV